MLVRTFTVCIFWALVYQCYHDNPPSQSAPIPEPVEIIKKKSDVLPPLPGNKEKRPIKAQPSLTIKHPQSPGIVIFPEDLPECIFSAAQPQPDHVDIIVRTLPCHYITFISCRGLR